MRVLALDTTTRGGSVAVVDNDEIVVQHASDSTRSHAERLPADVLDVLRAAALTFSAIDMFAVAVGPGSFTGLRIGIAAMQGFAFVNRRQIAPVSALEALAYSAADGLAAGTVIGAWMDAHRRDVFSALYRVKAPHDETCLQLLEELEPPAVGDPAGTLKRWEACAPSMLIGNGAVRYADVARPAVRIIPAPLLAGVIGRLAIRRARDGRANAAVDPAAVQPLYVRRPDAEIARDRTATL